MLRFVIFAVMALAIAMFVRLALMRMSMMGQSQRKPEPQVIEAEARFVSPLEIKGITFANFESDAGPADPQDFFEKMYVNVGGVDGENGRVYTLFVTTPNALAKQVETVREKHIFCRNLLVVEKYDLERIRQAVHEYVTEMEEISEEIG